MDEYLQTEMEALGLDKGPLTPYEIEKLAESAIMDRNILAVQILVRNIDKGPDHVDTLFAVFTHHLHPRSIPQLSQSDRDVVRSLDLALASFHGLVKIIGWELPEILPRYERAWPNIWRWIQFIVLHCCETPIPAVKTLHRGWKGSAYVMAVCFISTLASTTDHIIEMLSGTPGVLELLTRLWMKESKKGSRQFVAATAISKLITDEVDPGVNPKWVHRTTLDSIIRFAGGDFSKIASCSLARIRTNLARHPETDYTSLNSDLIMVMLLSVCHIPELRHAFLSQGSVTAITKAMARLSVHGPSSSSIDEPTGCLVVCMAYLQTPMITTDGFTWVLQALEAHILPTLLSVSGWACKDDDVPTQCTNILETIGPYLVYRSVLRVVARSLRRIESLQLEAKMVKKGKLWDTWNKFKDVAHMRLELKACYDEHPNAVCDNSGCREVDDSEMFMRCGGCLHVRYCGVSCQKEDWEKGRHREVCKNIRTRRLDGLREPTSTKDFAFLLDLIDFGRLVEHDHIEVLKQKQMQANPSADYSSLVTVFDYTEFPLVISVDPPGLVLETLGYNALESSERIHKYWREIVDTAKESKGLMVAARILVPQGATPLVFYTLLPSEDAPVPKIIVSKDVRALINTEADDTWGSSLLHPT